MRPRLIVAIAAALLLSPAAVAAPSSADARFKALSAREWAWREAQMAGNEDDDAPVSPRLPDESPANQQARLAYWTETLAALDRIPAGALSEPVKVDYAVYRAQIEALLASQRYRDYEKPLNADSAFWSDLTYAARLPFRSETDYVNFIAQMGQMPRYFREQIANMRAGLARGFTPPKVTLAGRESSITSVTEAKAPQDTVFYEPFKTMPASIPAARQAQLRAAAVTAITGQVVPAHRELLAFLRETYLPGARTTLAASALPDGTAYYRSKIREFTTLDLPPEEIHAIGLREVASIRAQMQAIMTEVGFKGDLPTFFAFLRTDTRFYPTTPEQLMKEAAWIAKRFDGKAASWFGRLPRQRFAIEPVPADIAPYYTYGRGGPGLYLLNTYDLPSRPLFSLTALTLHESAPGHAFQMPMALENGDQPAFRRKTYISAFGEGWALYCEKLGVEMGMYETPYDRFGMLNYQMWRAARLVVDTGIHAKGWTREQAIAYFHANSALAPHEIETEVDRYISWPGQALSYYLGEMAILDARAKAEKALGSKFDIRAFHDTVLSLGSVPLPVLQGRIDRFIAEGGKGPWPKDPR